MSEFTPRSFKELIDISAGIKKRALLVGVKNEKTLESVKRIYDEGKLELSIVDTDENIEQCTSNLISELDKSSIINVDSFSKGFRTAEEQVTEGKADLIIFGCEKWDEFLDWLFYDENPVITDSTIHIGLTKPDKYSKLLSISDSLINRKIDLKKKLKIIDSMIRFAGKISLSQPRIALLAAVEAVYPQMVSTTEAAIIAKMAERKQIKGCYLDGPLSFDIAVDSYAAEAKGVVGNEVAGNADMLIAPDIATANGVYKALIQFVKAEAGGLIFGGKVPIVANFPSESEQNRYHSIIMALLAS